MTKDSWESMQGGNGSWSDCYIPHDDFESRKRLNEELQSHCSTADDVLAIRNSLVRTRTNYDNGVNHPLAQNPNFIFSRWLVFECPETNVTCELDLCRHPLAARARLRLPVRI